MHLCHKLVLFFLRDRGLQPGQHGVDACQWNAAQELRDELGLWQ